MEGRITPYRLLKPLVKALLPIFSSLRYYLRYARINKLLEEYVTELLTYGIPFSLIGSVIISYIITTTFHFPFPIILALIPVFFLILFLVSILIGYMYPITLAQSRSRKIDNSLYLATIYMSSIAGSGTGPIAMFRLLAKMDEFSEISKDAKEIVQMVDKLGMDLSTAIDIVAEKTPNYAWKDLLRGIKTVMLEGGDMRKYLRERSRTFLQDFKRKLIEFTNELSLLLEIYITLVIVGSVFVLILTSIMGSISGLTTRTIQLIQQLVVFVFLPVSSIIFILIIKTINPTET